MKVKQDIEASELVNMMKDAKVWVNLKVYVILKRGQCFR